MKIGVKIYSYNWYLKYGLDYKDAAYLLEDQGIDFVIAQNKFMPMANSAVQSSPSPEQQRADLSDYDDCKFVDWLHNKDIEYWAACNIFFNPPVLKKYPEAIPVDNFGLPAKKVDWYIGICPSCDSYIQMRIEQIIEAVRHLRPNGVFLGFVRFPGFWELWLPTTKRSDWAEYCFCPRCCRKFMESRDLEIPRKYLDHAWEWVCQEAYSDFVDWKTDLIAGIVSEIKETVHQLDSNILIMLNTLAFLPGEFEDAGREVFGQDWNKLGKVVDIFELMTYHQILAREVHWIGRTVQAMRSKTNNPIASTIQVNPLYCKGVYVDKMRKEIISMEEFEQSIEIAKRAGAKRVVIFTWDDLLKETFEEDNVSRIDLLRKAKE